MDLLPSTFYFFFFFLQLLVIVVVTIVIVLVGVSEFICLFFLTQCFMIEKKRRLRACRYFVPF